MPALWAGSTHALLVHCQKYTNLIRTTVTFCTDDTPACISQVQQTLLRDVHGLLDNITVVKHTFSIPQMWCSPLEVS